MICYIYNFFRPGCRKCYLFSLIKSVDEAKVKSNMDNHKSWSILIQTLFLDRVVSPDLSDDEDPGNLGPVNKKSSAALTQQSCQGWNTCLIILYLLNCLIKNEIGSSFNYYFEYQRINIEWKAEDGTISILTNLSSFFQYYKLISIITRWFCICRSYELLCCIQLSFIFK